MSSGLPSITHLQFLMLDALAGGDAPGRVLRAVLAQHKVKRTAPAFYQMMARLEDSGFVEGWYDQKVVEGQLLKERRYRMTKTGARVLADTRAFYVERLAAAGRATRTSHA